jgi:cytochrome b6-f complex iron-sulfur subunit
MCPDEMDLEGSLPRSATRRRALELILGGVVAAMGAAAGRIGAGRRAGPDLLVCKLSELPPGSARTVQWEDQPVMVLNVGGTVRALSAICTHQGCEVEWEREQEKLLCPCHESVFDTNGKVVEGPAPAPLFAVPVVIRGGDIYLKTDS